MHENITLNSTTHSYKEINQLRTPFSKNPSMLNIFSKLDKIAKTDYTILLVGETGTGKEVMADYIYSKSLRKNKPFVKVGLASIPPNLIESELFGFAKGAFTGANDTKRGLFELADKGTIFLDDIDDFPVELQAKLLRILESQELIKIGSEKPVKVDVRVIASTKVDLKELVNHGKFRNDLYYRLNVVPINLPPLRERKEDIPLLIEEFINDTKGNGKIEITREALNALMSYNWPGNIRELKNVVHRMLLFADKVIDISDVPVEIKGNNAIESIVQACNVCFIERRMSMDEVVECLEKHLIREALKNSGGNQSKAAKYLSINRSRLRDKLIKYKLI